MAEDPPETPNYGFPIMSEADDEYVDLWHLILEDGGPTENDGLIEPLDAILDGIQSDVDDVDDDLQGHKDDPNPHSGSASDSRVDDVEGDVEGKADDPHGNDAHTTNYTDTSPSDVTSSNWGDYEIQKDGTDGDGIINFKTE